MEQYIWLKMPTLKSDGINTYTKPKYKIEQDATIIYLNDLAFVLCHKTSAMFDLTKFHDVQIIDISEIKKLSDDLPFPLPEMSERRLESNDFVGLGDIISWFLNKLGFIECESCSHRKATLNNIHLWKKKKK